METVLEYVARKEKEEYANEQEALRNPLPLFSIGDRIKRTDISENGKTHIIDRVRQLSKNETSWFIYHCEGQTFQHGWAWVAEHCIGRCDHA